MTTLDEWDDNLIIDAYDKSMELVNKHVNDRISIDNSVKDKANQKNQASKNKVKKWKVGDYCQAVYAEDGQLYEATIVSITNDNCLVKYIGYLNEETHKLVDLKESDGEDSRTNQIKRCQEERMVHLDKEEDNLEELDNLTDAFDQLTYLYHLNKSDNLMNNSKQQANVDSVKPCATSSSLHSRLVSHLQSNQNANQILIPPPPANLPNLVNSNENELLTTTLISWYMSGYHTGYYQATRDLQKNSAKND